MSKTFTAHSRHTRKALQKMAQKRKMRQSKKETSSEQTSTQTENKAHPPTERASQAEAPNEQDSKGAQTEKLTDAEAAKEQTHSPNTNNQNAAPKRAPTSPKKTPPKELPPPPESIGGLFGLLELLLKHRPKLFSLIAHERHLSDLIPGLLWLTLVCAFPVGAILGTYTGGWQIIYAAIKIPLLLLFTLAACFFAFWTWSQYFRTELSPAQVVSLSLSAISITSILLFGLTQLLWLFLDGSSGHYHRAITGLVCVFGLAGLGGVAVLYQGLRMLTWKTSSRRRGGTTAIAGIWITIYGFVGIQMTWMLRPYLFHPWAKGRPLTFLRTVEGSIYDSILRTLLTALGLQ